MANSTLPNPLRRLVVVLGDQLDPRSGAFDDFDPERDAVWMAEVTGETARHPNHRQRVVLFLSAMRHYAQDARQRGRAVRYTRLEDPDNRGTLPDELAAALDELDPAEVVTVDVGRHALEDELREVCEARDLKLEVRPDRHFLCSRTEFADWAEGKKTLVMETFYRWMRHRTGYLMDRDGRPLGDRWNFDKENRGSFGKDGPGADIKAPVRHRPDAVTREVMELVAGLDGLWGSLDSFEWPVTREEALRDLRDFVENRLADFGTYQDAMWTDRPFLYHSRISAAVNLRLLDPREVLEAAIEAHEAGAAPLQSVEGFVRQILGWREFMRGVYRLHMPGFDERNSLGAHQDLPEFFWTGDTDMVCVSQVVGQLLDTAYAHHIQRLMVTGLYALLLGVEPMQVHDWYMAYYIDSVEWVTLPNVVGMSQYADGGIVGTKPYIASGKYIDRMSNYCGGCRFDPAKAVGEDACPFTTLYWDFLARHRKRFENHRRMGLQVKNLDRKDAAEVREIRERAKAIRVGDL